jgi:hypothetical protein
MPKLYPVATGGCAPPAMVERDDNRCMLLLTCYRSGQMSEAQWYAHLNEEPGLREFAEGHAR